MDYLLLAQRGFDNWIEIVVIVLLVGGSAFAAVAKKLTEVFTPKEPGQSKPTIVDLAGKPRPSAPQRSAGPAHPVARPLPQPQLAAPAGGPQRRPPRPVPGRSMPEGRPSPPTPPRPRKSEAATAEERLGHLEAVLVGTTTAERLGHLEAGLAAATAPAEPHEPMDTIGRQTCPALRHAIVMREVLGPPIALRPPDQQL